MRPRRRWAAESQGFSLLELLVALAIGSLLLGLASASLVSSQRLGLRLELRGQEAQRRVAVPVLLSAVLDLAGRDIEACGLEVADGGTRLRLMGRAMGEVLPEVVEVFAGLDGGGRPALYQRTLPHARQPYLEEVSDLSVQAARDRDGVWQASVEPGPQRWTALELALGWEDGDRRSYVIDLPHMPCAGGLP